MGRRGPYGGGRLQPEERHIQDILSCLRVCPDICKGRAVYGLFYGYPAKKGEADAYLLMAPLRGKMLPAASSDESILFAASSPAAGRLTLLAMNNSPHTRQVVLPLGEEFAAVGEQSLPLPWSSSTDECAVAQDIPLDPALLKDATTVEFRCVDPAAGNGFTVYAAAVLAQLP